MSRSHLLLLSVLFCILLCAPVLAQACECDTNGASTCNPENIGNVTSNNIKIDSFADQTAVGANNVVWNISFYHVENLAGFYNLHTYTITDYVYPDWGNGYVPGMFPNDSTESIGLYDAAGTLIGTGRLSYSIDMSNRVVFSFVADYWNPGAATGTLHATIDYPHATGLGEKWRMHTGSATSGHPANVTSGITTVAFTNVDTPIAATQGPLYRWYTYYTAQQAGYERTEGTVEDFFKVDKCFENQVQGVSGVVVCRYIDTDLAYYDSGGWITVLKSYSNKTSFGAVPHHKNTRLRLTDTYGRIQEWYWTFCGEGELSITVSKGETPAFPATAGETIEAVGHFGGNAGQIGTVQWVWTEEGSVSSKSKIYTRNQSNGTWEDDYQTSSLARGAFNFDTQVMKQNIRFMLDDYDANWTAINSGNNVRLVLYDTLGNQIEPYAYKRVYVGSPIRSQTQFDIVTSGLTHIPNSQLWVKDITANVFQYAGDYISSGRVTNVSYQNHSYVAWASNANYTFAYGCYTVPTGSTCNQTSGANTLNYTVSWYGTGIVTLFIMPKEAGATNATMTFKVEDGDTGDPIMDAQIAIDYDIKINRYFAGPDGTVQIAHLIVGKSYPYTVTDPDYLSVSGNFTATNGGMILVKMYRTTTTVTPTPTGTPGPGEPGFVPQSPLESILSLLMLSGITTISAAKLAFALIICAVLAGVFGYYISFQASLIGMVIGFVGSTAFGLIDVWILLVVIFLGSIFLISKWWFGQSSGV